MDNGIRVLIVDDAEGDAERAAARLREAGLVVQMRRVASEDKLLQALDPPPDVVLVTTPLPNLDPIVVARLLAGRGIEAPIIVLARQGSKAAAVECLRCGIADYLPRDDLNRLGQAVRQALERRWLQQEAEAAGAALAESQAYLATIFEHTPVALVLLDADRRILKANAAASKLLSRDRSEGVVIGDALRCLNALSQPEGCGYSPRCPDCPLRAVVLECLERGEAQRQVECAIPVDADPASELALLVSATPIGPPERRQAVVVLEDITGQRAQQQRLRLVNRVLEMARAVGRLVLEEKSREWLLAETCRTIVETGRFTAAWVGTFEPAAGQLHALAAAGRDGLGLDSFSQEEAAPVGIETARAALESHRAVVAEAAARDAGLAAGQEPLPAGLRSCVTLPLFAGATPFGVLTVLADQTGVFSGEVLTLLEDLADELSLALEAAAVREERRRTQQALEESERNYREIFDAPSEAILILDAKGAVLDANAAALALSGYPSKEALVGRTLGDLSAGAVPFDPEAVASLVRQALEAGPQLFEWLARRRTGQPFWVEVSLRAASIGGQRRVLALLRDVSERRAAAELLRESEERFRSIFNRLPVGIYRATADGHIIAANAALLRLLGYASFDELAAHGADADGYFAPDARRAIRQDLERDGQVSGVETSWRRRDGQLVWVREVASVTRDEEGRPQFIDGIVEDVTDRKLAEQALEESEARYRAFFEEDLAADFIATTEGTLLDCNPAYVRLFGFASREEALATNVADLFAEPAARTALLATVREERRLELYPLELRRRDGSPIHALANIVGIFDAGGELTGTKGYLFDVTAMRQLEEQLRHAQKMEAVGRLAGGIAHDFNNLLQAMMSQLTLVKARLNDRQAVLAGVEEVERAIRRGAALARQLLVFSRRGPAQFAAFDLGEFLRQSSNFLRHVVRENILLEVLVPETSLPIVGDRNQIDQVLTNLVVNACDAMPDGGTLRIACSAIGTERVLLEVSDTGCGMSPAVRERIFEPFFTTKADGKGTGLGLAVVHGIVGQHGGEIQVESEEGRGTTFRILLPRAGSGEHPAISSEALVPVPPASGQGERILLVEDEPMARESLAEILSSAGYSVVAVGSGSEALALPHTPPFELLLTDFLLPDTKGNSLAKALLERWPKLRVLLMSGYTDDEILRQEILEGAVNFLQKPFDTETLVRAIGAALAARPGGAHPGGAAPASTRST